MGSQRSEQVWEETIMRFSLLPLATIVSPLLGQLKFNGGVSSSSSSNGNSPSSNRNTNRPSSGSSSGVTDVDEKFFLGGDTPSLTGNQALDGGIVGLGLGALGAAVLGPTIQGALNGAQQSQGYSCGRRKRQANFGGSQTSGGGGGGGATTAATSRPPRGSQATPGPTELAAVKDDDTNVLWHYLNSELLKLEIHMC